MKNKIKPILKPYPRLYKIAYKAYYKSLRTKQTILDIQDLLKNTRAGQPDIRLPSLHSVKACFNSLPTGLIMSRNELLLASLIIRVLKKHHTKLLSFLCCNSYILRKFKRPRTISHKKRLVVLHVSCSFDLGGTQRQIINICKNQKSEKYSHTSVEMFPEHNYIYRKEIVLDNNLYIQGNIFKRVLGYMTLCPPLRSWQLVQIYKLCRDIEQIKPDIIVGWGHEIAMLTYAAAAIKRVPKIIFCIRTFDPSHGWTTIGPLLEKAHGRMVASLNGIIVNSTPLKSNYSQWINIPASRISVCPNGINPCVSSDHNKLRSDIRRIHQIPDNSILILNIGRFSEEKGQMLLLKSYHKLLATHSKEMIHCILCGDGPELAAIKDYIKDNKLDNVVLPGRIDNIHPYLSAADIFVMPSDFEGMPNAMMEAMAHGLPCISTNKTGAVDIARDGEEALYINVGALDELTQRLAYLIDNPSEMQKIGQNAKKRLKDFSIQKMINRFEDCLEDFIKKRK